MYMFTECFKKYNGKIVLNNLNTNFSQGQDSASQKVFIHKF